MSDTVLVALLATIPPTVLAFATLIVGIRNTRKVEEVKRATNSMKDELVASTATEAHARGVKQGGEDERARQKESG